MLLNNIKSFIITEFNKPENFGKIMSGIGELSKEIKDFPTMECFFIRYIIL